MSMRIAERRRYSVMNLN